MPSQMSLIRGGRGGYSHTEEKTRLQQRHLKMEVRQPQPKECWLPPEAERRKGHILPLSPWKEYGPADLILAQ